MDSRDLLKKAQTRYLVALFALLAVTAVQGRVFLRWEGRSDVVGNLKRLGGNVSYETQVRINGGDGRLTVVSFDDALDNVAPRIRRTLAIPDNAPGNTGSLHVLREDAVTVRLLLLRIEETGYTLAIAIEQSNADFEASQAAPRHHQLKALPPYPGSRPLFFAEDADTSLRVAVSETMAHADAVHNFYDQELRAKGWIPSLPDSQGSTLPLPLYVRRSELCCIAVTPAQTASLQRITLLHKELGNTTK